MPFTGKATYTAGASLPEIAEDISDIVSVVSPFETPFLDYLGDGARPARSTVHEWLEDSLLPNTDQVNQSTFTPSPTGVASITVDHGARFKPGDQVRPGDSTEVMLVIAVAGNVVGVVRGYGGTTPHPIADNMPLHILGGAAFEGDDRPAAIFTNRVRRSNYSQIFTASVEVSGSQLAVNTIGVRDELDFQKQERLRELLRDLESCVINGAAPTSGGEGSGSVRRTMRGVIPHIVTNRFAPGVGPIPDGAGSGGNLLTEEVLNAAMRRVWEQSSSRVDTILVNGFQKRRINSFITGSVGYTPSDSKWREMVSVYESDFGVARVVLSRWAPAGSVVLLDSSRIDVMPLAGRAFHYKPLAASGDHEIGQIIGEYTVEMRNELAHGILSGLATSAD
ncbi:MAG: DUF5309 family protein [Phycisphaerales bacterium]|nr:DUF5309 family protein [Phycisphaerales bacterium]